LASNANTLLQTESARMGPPRNVRGRLNVIIWANKLAAKH
jgi:hypothetical protein